MRTGALRYIAVEGPIGVGKTTLACRLADSLGGNVVREGAEENPFLARFYQNPRAHALGTQLFFLLQRAGQVAELRQADLFSPVCVADFMLDKDRLFAELNLDEDELRLYDEIYSRLTLDAPVPDLVIYLQAPVNVLLERIRKRALSYERTIDGAYLERLSGAYMRLFHDFRASPLLIVNAGQIDIPGNEGDYNLLLQEVRRTRSGRQYFNPTPL